MGGKGLIPKCLITGYIPTRVAAKRAEREADFAGGTASRGSRGGTPGCLSFFTYTKPPVCVDFGRRLSSPVILFFCPFYPAPWTTGRRLSGRFSIFVHHGIDGRCPTRRALRL